MPVQGLVDMLIIFLTTHFSTFLKLAPIFVRDFDGGTIEGLKYHWFLIQDELNIFLTLHVSCSKNPYHIPTFVGLPQCMPDI